MKLAQVAIAIAALVDYVFAKGYDSTGAGGGLSIAIRQRGPEGGGGGREGVNKFLENIRINHQKVESDRRDGVLYSYRGEERREHFRGAAEFGHQGFPETKSGGGAAGFGRGEYGGDVAPPQPYSFDYQVLADDEAHTHYRTEERDVNGSVRGTYGYRDSQGLYRIVEYVADENGFRANIRTNEPGVGKQSPADVVLIAEEPPAGIQDRYTSAGGRYGSGGGYRDGVDRSRVFRGGAGRGPGVHKSGAGGDRRGFSDDDSGAGAGEVGGTRRGDSRTVGFKKAMGSKATSGKSGY